MNEEIFNKFATAIKDKCIDDNGSINMLEVIDLVSSYSIATISAISGACNVNRDHYVMILDGFDSINKARSQIAIDQYEERKADAKEVADSVNDLMKRILN